MTMLNTGIYHQNLLAFKTLDVFMKLGAALMIYFLSQSAALALDDSILDVDQVENLIKFCPTKEEMELLKVQIIVIAFIYYILLYIDDLSFTIFSLMVFYW